MCELRVIMHEEMHQLAEKYRASLLLCYWEGKTHDEAFFFLMIRRPPRSTLFPYDALPIWTRSRSFVASVNRIATGVGIRPDSTAIAIRSEEHTSELQSHVNLVCRLLL